MIEDEAYKITEGQAFQFAADKKHTYENQGKELVDLAMLVYYP